MVNSSGQYKKPTPSKSHYHKHANHSNKGKDIIRSIEDHVASTRNSPSIYKNTSKTLSRDAGVCSQKQDKKCHFYNVAQRPKKIHEQKEQLLVTKEKEMQVLLELDIMKRILEELTMSVRKANKRN